MGNNATLTCDGNFSPLQTLCHDGNSCNNLNLSNPPTSSASPQDHVSFIPANTPVDVTWEIANPDTTVNPPGPDPIDFNDNPVSYSIEAIGSFSLNEGPADVRTQTTSDPITISTTHVGGNQDFAVVRYRVKCTPPQTTLTLKKTLINDNGGQATVPQFTLTYTNNANNAITGSGAHGTPAVTNVTVPAGTYTISENGPAGYTQSLACSGAADANPNDGLTIAAGENVTCTFTNNDLPPTTGTLTLQKTVINDSGGNAPDSAFTLTYTNNADNTITGSGAEGASAVTGVTVPTGTYTLSETGPAGYTQQSLVCSGAADANPNDGLTIANGENVTCTFTNNDNVVVQQSRLTLTKVVINDNGGQATADDFNLSFSGQGGSGSGVSGSAGVTNVIVSPGSYTLSEDGPLGYTLTSLTCTGGSDANGADGLNVGAGESVTCTFRNDDRPDNRTEEEVKRFVHRRVDNLLTYGPDRARMLRRLQDGAPPQSLKDEPLKMVDGSGGLGTAAVASRGPAATVPGFGPRPTGVMGIGAIGQDYAGRPFPSATENENETYPYGSPFGPTSGSSSVISQFASQMMPLTGQQQSFKFSTSLSELTAAAAAAEERKTREQLQAAGMGFGEQPLLNRYAAVRPGLDVWIEGHISRYDDNIGGINRDGDFKILYVGADYLLAPGILIGALAQVDDTREDIDDPAVQGIIEGTGWMAGPYVGIRLTDSLFFDARAAWGRSDNDIDLNDAEIGPRHGSFDTDRWLASASLTGNHYVGPWRLTPQVSLAYGDESFGSFATSLGQTILGSGAHIGRLTGTMEVGYRFLKPDGSSIEPHVALSGIWNFDSSDLVINGELVDSDESRAKIEGGVLMTMPNGLGLRAAASYDGIGADDFDAVSGSLWINIPLN